MTELEQFEAILRSVEPAVRLVPERHLRKLLHYFRDHGRRIPRNPDRPLWVSREELANADVVPRDAFRGTDDPLLLITTPDDRSLDSLPPAELLREYWRLLFEAAISAKLARLHETTCEARLLKLGPAAVREVKYVLESEHLADPESSDVDWYRVFATAYLTVHTFEPDAIGDFFPSLPSSEEVLGLIGPETEAESILSRTRPPGAADAVRPTHNVLVDAAAQQPRGRPAESLRSEARAALERGNFVRSAILFTQAGDGAAEPLGHLVKSLAAVLGWEESTRGKWQHALATLLPPAAAGRWPRAARCLYELQKIPQDLAREVFAVDLVEPIRTLGRRPVKRPLPHAREVMVLLALRQSNHQMLRSGLDAHAQHALDRLFEAEMLQRQEAIRARLAPIIENALEQCGFVPGNRAESVARDKVVAELLDRICERGYLRFGNLRDAIARNQLKMPDLRGPGEFIAGDPLLKVDTRLAYDLDGIYRRGEFYLRALQRGSSIFFGTGTGRWLFLYLIAPFLAAFLTLTFAIELKHLSEKVQRFATKILAPRQVYRTPALAHSETVVVEQIVYSWDESGMLVWSLYEEPEWIDDEPDLDPDQVIEIVRTTLTSSTPPPSMVPGEAHESTFPRWESVFVLGVFLLLMFHAPPFRQAFFSVASGLVAALVSLLWDLPKRLMQSRVVVVVRYSAPARFFVRYLIAPMLVAGIVVLFLSFLGASQNRLMRWGGIVLGVAFLAFNTPWGWSVQERLAESISDGWRIFRVNLIPGLIATVLDWFRRLVNWFERQLYEVDEWLRFRGGDSGGSLAAKAILGLVWFPVAYLARFSFYLLIEPQVNPVKHFPVVTVSHKVILPLTPTLAEALNVSTGVAFWILAGVPGVFGFIAWELLSNWKLYAANRPERLKPVVIGSHGETMRGLLRPGFHSGTVPKLYRKLRRAKDGRAKDSLHHELHHVIEAVRRFLERELISLAEQWTDRSIRISEVRLGCQRLVVMVTVPDIGDEPLTLAFENCGGKIDAHIASPGWIDKLTQSQRGALFDALRGLFDMVAAEQCHGRDRGPEAPNGTDLCRTWSWDEWTRRWG